MYRDLRCYPIISIISNTSFYEKRRSINISDLTIEVVIEWCYCKIFEGLIKIDEMHSSLDVSISHKLDLIASYLLLHSNKRGA